jgi:tetratricopeptide (TPR) repeat protein
MPRVVVYLVFGLALLMQAGCSRVRGLFERDKVLTPVEVFQKVSPSVFVVEALTEDGKPLMLGSGVALAQDILITNCHVVQNGSSLRVRRGEQNWTARLIEAMPEHDLCGIRPNGLNLQPVQITFSPELATGEHVYAVGSPEGLELTFSEGLISALRDNGGAHVIQTTAPISPGSSGGGLFDTHGKLIGITTFYLKEGQSLNFALPSEWVKAMVEKGSAAPGKPPTRQSDAELESAAWLQIGLEAAKNEDYELASQSLIKCRNLKQPTAARAYFELGKIAERASLNPSKAYDAWFHKYSWSPDEAMVQALQAFENAIELKPDYAEAWLELSRCHDLRKEYDQAVSAAKEATRLAPNGWEGWFNLGCGLFQTESYDEAIEALQHADRVAPEPEHTKVLVVLGWTYAKKGDREHVLKVYQELQAVNSVAAKYFFQEYVLPQQHTVQPGKSSK